MNMNKIKATLFIVLFLLVAAVTVYIVTGNNTDREYHPTGVPAAVTAQPVETVPPLAVTAAPTVAPTAVPTAVPTPEVILVETPAPTPAPTPVPTPEPIPVGTVIGSGSFVSDTGTGGLLDLVASYTAVTTGETSATVTVTVDLRHYQLNMNPAYSLNINLNGNYQTLYVDGIVQEDGVLNTDTLGTYDFPVTIAAGQSLSLPLEVVWNFGGTYHGVDLPVVECGGTVVLAR